MNQIVTSLISLSNTQIDGRIAVRERHTDDSGNLYLVDYMADKNMNLTNHLANDALQLTAQLQFLAANAIPLAQEAVARQQDVIRADNDYLAVLQANLDALLHAPPAQPGGLG